tara:strand:+ start:326 stop:460 length:135 start_codon:yes stop_codon:yes gene_type:complete
MKRKRKLYNADENSTFKMMFGFEYPKRFIHQMKPKVKQLKPIRL